MLDRRDAAIDKIGAIWCDRRGAAIDEAGGEITQKIKILERERERSVRGFVARRLWVEDRFVGL